MSEKSPWGFLGDLAAFAVLWWASPFLLFVLVALLLIPVMLIEWLFPGALLPLEEAAGVWLGWLGLN
ncbi:MAG: hypothetical protein RRB13_12400 [bacterium]|nr:hypothetical protein [bacterium]